MNNKKQISTALFTFFFQTSTLFASCLKENIIEDQYLITQNLKPSMASLKTLSTDIDIIKSLKGKKNSLKTNSQDLFKETFLISSKKTIEGIKKYFPDASVQNNCLVQIKTHKIENNSDPLYRNQKWFFDSINLTPYNLAAPLRPVVVAVSDTGVDVNHPDLRKNIWVNYIEKIGLPGIDDDGNGYIDDINGYDFADNDNNPVPTRFDTFADPDHGTHVAGLIAAESNNLIGVSGVAGNSIRMMALKGFKSNAPATLADLLESIYYAVDNGAQIINASWGAEKRGEAAEINAINYATRHGVVFVAAAGNDTQLASRFVPASIRNAVTVASINSNGLLSTFSNYGSVVDFVAPGGDGFERLNEDLMSTALNGRYLALRGTSMAAPIVSGALALLLAQNRNITPFQALNALKHTSNKVDLYSYDVRDRRTYNHINLHRALRYPFRQSVIEEPNDNDEFSDFNSLEIERNLANSDADNSSGCSKKGSGQTPNEGSLPLSALFFLFPIFILLKSKRSLK